MPEDSTRSLEGTVVDGRYEIEEELGRGGMGAVYRATQVALARRVAFKVLRPDVEHDPVHAERMLVEAKATSSIRHQNVVEVIDFGKLPDETPYFVMEFLVGRDLAEVLESEGRLAWSRTRGIMLQVLAGLRAAHRKGVLHRDIKPSNCFLVEDRDGEPGDYVKLLDFGIAKVAAREGGEGRRLTHHSFIVGTARYMAPEVFDGAEASEQSDLYAVGVLGYKMLTGQPPFTGRKLHELMHQVRTEGPTPMRDYAPDVPAPVDRMVMRALAKRLDDRYRDTTEFEAAILEIDAAGRRRASGRTGTVVEQPAVRTTQPAIIAAPVVPVPVDPAAPGRTLRPAPARTLRPAESEPPEMAETRPLTPMPGTAARAPTPSGPASASAWTRPQMEDAPRSSATFAIVLAIVVGALVGASFIVFARFDGGPDAEAAPSDAEAAPKPDPELERTPESEPEPEPGLRRAPAPEPEPEPEPEVAPNPERQPQPDVEREPEPKATSSTKPKGKGSAKSKSGRDKHAEAQTDASVKAQIKQVLKVKCGEVAATEATVQVKFTVGSDGGVSLVRVGAPHNAGPLAACIKNVVRVAEFPAGTLRVQKLAVSL